MCNPNSKKLIKIIFTVKLDFFLDFFWWGKIYKVKFNTKIMEAHRPHVVQIDLRKGSRQVRDAYQDYLTAVNELETFMQERGLLRRPVNIYTRIKDIKS